MTHFFLRHLKRASFVFLLIFSCYAIKAQNVGIGTNSPAVKFEIVTTDLVGFRHTNGTVSVESQISGTDAWFGTSTPNHNFHLLAGGFDQMIIRGDNSRVGFGRNPTNQHLEVEGGGYFTGNLGIGTPTPTHALEIATGTEPYTTALSILPSTSANSKRASIQLDDWEMLQDLSGVSNTKDFAIYQQSSGLQRVVISTGGNVGIGNLNPAAKLDITGSIKIADGTQGSGKVLMSDDNGLASWQAVSTKASYHAFNYNTPITVPNGVETPANFADVKYNENMVFNNGVFTIPYTGLYHFDVVAGPNFGYTNTIGEEIRVKINGNYFDVVYGYLLSVDIKVNTGDLVSFLIFQNSGSTQTMGNFSRISCHKVN